MIQVSILEGAKASAGGFKLHILNTFGYKFSGIWEVSNLQKIRVELKVFGLELLVGVDPIG
jgi:hypothetical protein